jgi:hypothetical protein
MLLRQQFRELPIVTACDEQKPACLAAIAPGAPALDRTGVL